MIVKTNHVRLAVYSVTAYGITTIIVDATILLHKYQTNNAGYGGHDFCYIASPQSKIYCDILPMFMIFLTTLIFSMHILCHLWKREKKARRALQASGRHENNIFYIAFKLPLTLSFTEVFQFIWVPKNNPSESELLFNYVFYTL